MERNLSARLYGVFDLRLEEGSIPTPSNGEVQVRMKNCGICGTDIYLWSSGLSGHESPIVDPVVIGHESSGVVTAVASDVTHLKVGDRVALELGLPCRRIPDNVSFEAGALIEPLAVAVHACRRAGVSAGQRVLIGGAGTIGLCCLLVVRALGVSEICITDVSSFRLKLAVKLGATYTVLVKREEQEKELGPSAQDDGRGRRLADEIIRQMSNQNPDCSIECSGAPVSLQAAIYATKSGGVMTPVGLDPMDVRLPLVNAATREIDIRGSFSYCNDYPAAISLVASGRVDPLPLVTTRFDLTEVVDAFQLAKQSQEGVLKVMIACN